MTRRAAAPTGCGQSSVISGTSSPPCRSTRISERSSSCSNLTRTLDGPLSSMRYDQPVDGVGSSASETAPFASVTTIEPPALVNVDVDGAAGVGPARGWRPTWRTSSSRSTCAVVEWSTSADVLGGDVLGTLEGGGVVAVSGRRGSGLGGRRPHCRSVVVGDQHAGGEDDGATAAAAVSASRRHASVVGHEPAARRSGARRRRRSVR